jgi:hypothetical protein
MSQHMMAELMSHDEIKIPGNPEFAQVRRIVDF